MERVACSKAILELVEVDPGLLEPYITMDETMVSLFMPEMKQQSGQWLPRGSLAPTKAKTQASRHKRMVLAFFDAEDLVYTRITPRGTSINGLYMI